MVDVPAPVDGDVFHRQRPGAPVLHRAVLPARLRELYVGRRYPADPAGDLEWRALSRVSRRPVVRPPARSLRRLRVALEPVTRMRARHARDGSTPHRASAARIAVVIPTWNEEDAIGTVIRTIPRDLVERVIVADSHSSDGTAARAAGAGADVIRVGRGYGRACLAGVDAAQE